RPGPAGSSPTKSQSTRENIRESVAPRPDRLFPQGDLVQAGWVRHVGCKANAGAGLSLHLVGHPGASRSPPRPGVHHTRFAARRGGSIVSTRKMILAGLMAAVGVLVFDSDALAFGKRRGKGCAGGGWGGGCYGA